jgi:lipopolysaccharide transport system permease protein
MVGIIDGFKWSLLGGRVSIDPFVVTISVVVTMLSLVVGLRYFRQTERGFADAI